MLPQDRIGAATNSQMGENSSNPLYNNLSKLGNSSPNSEEVAETENVPENPAEKFIRQAGSLISQMEDLNSLYSNAGAEPELREAVQKIAEWMNKINGSLNSGSKV